MKFFKSFALVSLALLALSSCEKEYDPFNGAPIINQMSGAVIGSDGQSLFVLDWMKPDTLVVPVADPSTVDLTEFYGCQPGSPVTVHYTGELYGDYQVMKVSTDPTYHNILGAWSLGGDSLCFGPAGIALSTTPAIPLVGWQLTDQVNVVNLIFSTGAVTPITIVPMNGTCVFNLGDENTWYIRNY